MTRPAMSTSYVLIADDDPVACAFLRGVLAAYGYDTIFAANGAEALKRMQERRPCVVLLDLLMPEMDGWEFRRRQLENAELAGVPVVAITAHYDPGQVRDELGVPCLRKPLLPSDVLAAVRAACAAPDDKS